MGLIIFCYLRIKKNELYISKLCYKQLCRRINYQLNLPINPRYLHRNYNDDIYEAILRKIHYLLY